MKKITILGLSMIILVIITIIVLATGIKDYNSDGSDPSLVAYWKLDGNALDETNNYNGTVSGATVTDDGRFKQGYNFDGNDDYITVPDSDVFFFNESDFAITMWVKFNTFQRFQSFIGQFYDGSSNDWIIQSDFQATKKIKFYRDGAATVTFTDLVLSLDTWYFFVFSRESGTLTMYQDTVSISSGALGDIDNSPSDLEIGGASGDGVTTAVDGKIDEVRIYNRSLNASEIRELYNETVYSHSVKITGVTTFNETGIVGHWGLNGNANDYYGNLNGTHIGTGTENSSDCPYGNCYFFTGNGRINITSNVEATFPMAVSFWAKFLEDGWTNVLGISKATLVNQSWTIRKDSSNNVEFRLSTDGGSGSVCRQPKVILNRWYHFVYSLNVTGLYVYMDGELEGMSGCPDTVYDSQQPFTIGQLGTGTSAADKYIDNVILYNRTISASEVVTLYKYDYEQHTNPDSSRHIQIKPPITDGLVGYWDLNEDAIDQLGTYNGTIAGAVNTTGHFGDSNTAMAIDGTTNHIVLGTGTDFFDLCENGCSFAMWFKIAKTGVNNFLVSRYDSSGNSEFFQTFIDNGGDTRFLIDDNGDALSEGNRCHFDYRDDDIIIDTWYHHIWFYDPVNDLVGFYRDGVLKHAEPCLGFDEINITAWNKSETTFFAIYDDGGAGSGRFNGSVDNIRFYNKVLSLRESKILYEEEVDEFDAWSMHFQIYGSPDMI